MRLRRPRVVERKSAGRGRGRAAGVPEQVTPAETPLWEALRACRSELARQQNLPPYVIFHDATLLAMLRARPMDLDDFAVLPGVGARKLERYGEIFLAVIRAHPDA
jgi:ATP-dependent DNA helicase RecQ